MQQWFANLMIKISDFAPVKEALALIRMKPTRYVPLIWSCGEPFVQTEKLKLKLM